MRFSSLEFLGDLLECRKQLTNINGREEPGDHEKCSSGSRKQWSYFLTRSETKGRFASWLSTIAFSLLLLSIRLSKPILQPQGPHSLWLAIIGMINFILFVLATRVMKVSDAENHYAGFLCGFLFSFVMLDVVIFVLGYQITN